MQSNQIKRQIHAILRELTYVISAVPKGALPNVARGLADSYSLPRKAMLKAMARYIRLYR